MTLFTAQAQNDLSKDYSYKVSKPYPVFDALTKYYFTKANEALAVKFDGKDILIQKFNTDNPSFTKEKRYENPFQKEYQIESVLEVSNHLYLFFSSPEAGTNNEQIFSAEINFDQGEFIGQPKLLFHRSANAGKINFLQSADKRNLLIQHLKKPELNNEKKAIELMELYSYDSSLNQIFKSEATMPYPQTKISNLDYQVDNRGNMYMLAKVFNDNSQEIKKIRKDTEANYHLELLLIKAAQSAVEITKFESKDKFINKLWLFDSNKGYLICAGYYSNGQGRFDDCNGITSCHINPDGSIHDQVFHEIPASVINQDEKPQTVKKNERRVIKGKNSPFSNLELRDIFVNEDGSTILMGEKYFVVNHTTTDTKDGNSHTIYRYHYTDMLVSKINADGSLGWMKKIKKNQVGSRSKGAMSFKSFNANDSHYLVFFDNEKNIALPLKKKPKKQRTDGKGGSLTSVRIADKTGDLKKSAIFDFDEFKDFKIQQFAINRVFQSNENAFMLEVFKEQNEDLMIKVNLNK